MEGEILDPPCRRTRIAGPMSAWRGLKRQLATGTDPGNRGTRVQIASRTNTHQKRKRNITKATVSQRATGPGKSSANTAERVRGGHARLGERAYRKAHAPGNKPLLRREPRDETKSRIQRQTPSTTQSAGQRQRKARNPIPRRSGSVQTQERES